MLSEDPLATERHPHVRGDDASAPGVIRTHDPLLRRYFALSAVLP